ncbi:MAG TPA: hypothetical protein VGV89_00290 [Thermoplasmata archaeon]|nr:hypothetical protein [Thermoplasmata archaeon]
MAAGPARWTDRLRARPELIAIPTAVAFLVFTVLYDWATEPGLSTPFTFLGALLVALVLGPPGENLGPIFPITWVSAWVTFFVVLWLLRTRTELGTVRAVLVAATVPFGATGVFEISYQLMGSVLQPWAFHAVYAWWVLWTAIGFTGIGYFRFGRAVWVLLTGYLGGFLAWGATGFDQVEWGPPATHPLAYGFNIPLKIAAFVLFGLVVHYGTAVTGSTRGHRATGSLPLVPWTASSSPVDPAE